MKSAALTGRVVALLAALLLYAQPVCAQTTVPPRIGSVSAADADVSDPQGALRVVGERVELTGSSSVKAHNHTAAIKLARGGSIAVCRGSTLHVTAAPVSGAVAPLLLSLDRGALEVRMKSVSGDAIVTPDLRLSAPAGSTLELNLNVNASGDTCIDNRNAAGPMLNVSDAFGEASYVVKPGQHLLFEHGDLHAVVDRESIACGCPPADKPGVSIAEALLASHGKMTPAAAEAAHPFPAAVSSGLAAPPERAPEAGGTHVQVATTLNYDPAQPTPATADSDAPTPPPAPAAAAQPALPHPVKQPSGRGPFRAIGRFFKRLFVR